MKQDVLHVRDAVSKTITVDNERNIITIISDLDHDEMVVPNSYLPEIERLFEFSYNRADDFKESKNGVWLNISGGQYTEQVGDPVQKIYEKVKG